MTETRRLKNVVIFIQTIIIINFQHTKRKYFIQISRSLSYQVADT